LDKQEIPYFFIEMGFKKNYNGGIIDPWPMGFIGLSIMTGRRGFGFLDPLLGC